MKKIDLTNIKTLTIALLTALITTIVLLIAKTNVIWVVVRALSPIVSAFLIAYMLDYILTQLKEKLKINRILGFIVTMFLIFLFMYTLIASLIPALKDAVVQLYETVNKTNFDDIKIFNIKLAEIDFIGLKDIFAESLQTLVKRIAQFSSQGVLNVLVGVKNVLVATFSWLAIFVIAIYMLIEKEALCNGLKRTSKAILSPAVYDKTTHVLGLTDDIFKKFVFGKVIDSIIIGILTYIVISVFKFKYAVLIAFIVGVTNVIPYVGPFIGAVPALLTTLLASFDEPIRVLFMGIIILAIQQLDGLVIGPKILGDTVGVSPFWILLAITVGGAIFGFMGMFLGVPTVVLIKTLVGEYVEMKERQREEAAENK